MVTLANTTTTYTDGKHAKNDSRSEGKTRHGVHVPNPNPNPTLL